MAATGKRRLVEASQGIIIFSCSLYGERALDVQRSSKPFYELVKARDRHKQQSISCSIMRSFCSDVDHTLITCDIFQEKYAVQAYGCVFFETGNSTTLQSIR